GVLIDGREEAPDSLGTQVERPLPGRCRRSGGRYGNIRHVVPGPALRLLVPPDNRFRIRIRFTVFVARRAVIEDAHVVRPGPPETGIKAEAPRIRFRVAALRQVLPSCEHARVDPSAR